MEERKEFKKLAVLTSGGDAPGMNSTIRSVVRAALSSGFEIYGVKRGYTGLINGEIYKMGTRDVSDILQKGGTFLMTSRCEEMRTPEGVQKGVGMLKTYDIDGLVVIGGDGSFRGAYELSKAGIPVIGIPATIDNDVACTEYTVGFDTAMNTALDALDKLRDTATSHERCEVVEVMGREAGYIALNVGFAAGAEVILIPEIKYDIDKTVIKSIIDGRNIGKHHYVVVVAEGAGDAKYIADYIQKTTGIEAKATILGHIQRGGSPSLRDRLTGSRMGIAAIDCFSNGMYNRLVVEKNGKIIDIDIVDGINEKKTITEKELEDTKKLF